MVFCRGIWHIVFEKARISFVIVLIEQYSSPRCAYKFTGSNLSCTSVVQTPHGPVVSSARYHLTRMLETLHGSLYAIRERELARRNLKWNSDRGECIHSPMIGMMLITNLCHIQITSDTINALTKSFGHRIPVGGSTWAIISTSHHYGLVRTPVLENGGDSASTGHRHV